MHNSVFLVAQVKVFFIAGHLMMITITFKLLVWWLPLYTAYWKLHPHALQSKSQQLRPAENQFGWD